MNETFFSNLGKMGCRPVTFTLANKANQKRMTEVNFHLKVWLLIVLTSTTVKSTCCGNSSHVGCCPIMGSLPLDALPGCTFDLIPEEMLDEFLAYDTVRLAESARRQRSVTIFDSGKQVTIECMKDGSWFPERYVNGQMIPWFLESEGWTYSCDGGTIFLLKIRNEG
jgi:hypothetical protein